MLSTVRFRLRRWRRPLLPVKAGESGQALLLVMISLTLLIAVPIAVATTVSDQLPQTTRNLNWDAAYEAAQAGLNDYLQHLDAASSDTGASQTTWLEDSTTPAEYYTYYPTTEVGGLISLKVSGKGGSGADAVIRNFEYTIRPDSSLDYIYWSNYETIDPSIDNGVSGCAVYNGQGNVPSDCVVNFNTGDVLDGPVFSNDTFRICGSPVFESTVESGNIYTGASTVWIQGSGSGCSTASLASGTKFSKVSNQEPPTTSADATPAQEYGCYYSGGNATITLSSPSSGNTNITVSGSGLTATKASGNTNSCPVGTAFALSSMNSGLIYVNGQISISGSMSGQLDIVSATNILLTGNITYPSGNINTTTGTDTVDSLGLIASDSVEVMDVKNETIDAAILAVNDSFYVENWGGAGNLGTLTVFGAIAQNFRGPVGTFSGSTILDGYSKAYQYDNSLQTLWPPYFLAPDGAVWTPSAYTECTPGNGHSVVTSTTNC